MGVKDQGTTYSGEVLDNIPRSWKGEDFYYSGKLKVRGKGEGGCSQPANSCQEEGCSHKVFSEIPHPHPSPHPGAQEQSPPRLSEAAAWLPLRWIQWDAEGCLKHPFSSQPGRPVCWLW